nr:putative methyltransferase NSUN6 isoform X3 [Ipomoea batatas]GMD38557.1 putative methyltransferase NSUN6 isoform X3 [Ipomoea batatas]
MVVLRSGSGPHAIDYGYKEAKLPKEVIVSRKCAEAVLRGAQVFVPGVLACSAHVEKGDVVAVSVAVEQPGPEGGWGIGMTRGTVLQGSPTGKKNMILMDSWTTMLSRAGIFRVPQGVAVDMHNRVFELPSFNELLEGEIFLQNLPSIIAAHALDPQPGERILDMCAAPGEIIHSTMSRYLTISAENVQTRSSGYTSKAELRKSIRKMRNGPGRNHCSGGRVEKSKGFAPNSFDRVLLDAPCSALGLRPRLFAGEVSYFCDLSCYKFTSAHLNNLFWLLVETSIDKKTCSTIHFKIIYCCLKL